VSYELEKNTINITSKRFIYQLGSFAFSTIATCLSLFSVMSFLLDTLYNRQPKVLKCRIVWLILI